MGTDRHEKIRQRAYEIWEREGRPDGKPERHWQQAINELDCERVHDLDAGIKIVPTARATSRKKRRVAKGDVLAEDALAIKTGISGDKAETLIDRCGGDLETAEQAARNK